MMLREMYWLCFRDLVKFHTLILLLKCINKMFPSYLNSSYKCDWNPNNVTNKKELDTTGAKLFFKKNKIVYLIKC